ncbi:MAG: transporter substrate-binding domain-containing protein [Rickettsiales bacterium]|jgi:polar amino acid transport system substrate-binding protein|nr:transporter substrate-binding domain-containing protein [Rickettsiales bacterium]
MKIKSMFYGLMLTFAVIGAVNAREILIGISPIRPPFMYIDKSGEIVGYDPDLARAVLKKLGHEAKFVQMQFDGLLPSLTTGKIDMIASGFTITEERKKRVDYSDPYNEVFSKIVIKENDNSINSIKDLKGKRVGAELGTVQLDFAESNAKKYGYEVVIFNSANEMFLDLIKNVGGVDAIIENSTLAKRYIKEKNAKIKMVGDKIKPSRPAFAFKKGNEKFVKEINEALKQTVESGEQKALYDKYFD